MKVKLIMEKLDITHNFIFYNIFTNLYLMKKVHILQAFNKELLQLTTNLHINHILIE